MFWIYRNQKGIMSYGAGKGFCRPWKTQVFLAHR
ncbi:hypothetical protein NC651_009431 [Populus alba x Populus x berolinensis]|uniref:Uncharacterized protein n=1 Tax=Populus alba x Populus x berolinensis TaxID=444605 RepID=A0AAD6WA05_9ROSI|nr:hypothetical protein NC651_009431 [Populus alba x Populus x berolinensis]KAJ7004898.1 hypothetical protein NC653_009663 [Populus alba x Populus x berolinensis]